VRVEPVLGDPYLPPKAPGDIPAEPPNRNRWIAGALGLVWPFIGMLYVGRPVRALVYLLVPLLFLVLVLALGWKGIGNLGMAVRLFSLVIAVVGAADCYRLARKWNRTVAPWYSRAPALIAFLLVGYAAILGFRAFIMEPFRIPAASMEPTLQVGDHILVDKLSYGWNVPFGKRRIVTFADPQRGDVAVFRYPQDESLDYVKRVVGIPGDTIAYRDKRLHINGREVTLEHEGWTTFTHPSAPDQEAKVQRYREGLGNAKHSILINPDVEPYVRAAVRQFPGYENCKYEESSFECKVPAGQYFVMGDNRDQSSDSRYWGFVPLDHFHGRVFVVWYSEKPGRAGTDIQ